MNLLTKCKELLTIYTLVQIICSIGCFMQIEYVFTRYFAREITIVTTVEIPDETILPDFVIRVEVLRFINYTLFFKRFPHVGTLASFKYNNIHELKTSLKNLTLTKRISQLIEKELTIKEMTSLLYKPKDFIKTIYVRSIETMKAGSFNSDYVDRCQFKQYYQSSFFYIVIACSTEGPIIGSFILKDLNPGIADFFAVVLTQAIAFTQEGIQIAFIESNSPPNSQKIQWTRLPLHDGNAVYTTSFKLITLSFLPAPYSSCVNYSDEGYDNRFEKLDECLNKLSQKWFNRPFHQSLHRADIDEPFVGFDQDLKFENETFAKLSNDILTKCEAATMGLDCYERHYNVKEPDAVRSLFPLTAIILGISNQPYIEMVAKPKLNVLDCIVSVGSIFGFWFGFALNVHVPWITCLIKSKLMPIRNKKLTKINKYPPRDGPIHKIKLAQLNVELNNNYFTLRPRESNRLTIKNSKRFTIN
uniref:Uncharacterized protein n=1 Tax=Tetranychus urticae TaxID=32264 RepID=T1KWH5_TETUR